MVPLLQQVPPPPPNKSHPWCQWLFMHQRLAIIQSYVLTCLSRVFCCVQVREAVSILDLDVLVYPCPKGGPTWRQKAVAMGGKAQFPYLVDPNTGMYQVLSLVSS